MAKKQPRKVNQDFWLDPLFRGLSKDARYLWLYLLTGPDYAGAGFTLGGSGRIVDASCLGQEGFAAAFKELEEAGIAKADWDALLVWCKGGQSEAVDPAVPDCPLKEEGFALVAQSKTPNTQDQSPKEIWNTYIELWRVNIGQGVEPKMTPQRKSQIKSRLATYPKDVLLKAVEALFDDPWMRGQNPESKVYLNPEQVFGSDQKVEKRLASKSSSKQKTNGHSWLAQAEENTLLLLEGLDV